MKLRFPDTGEDYYQRLARAFDQIAPRYDRTYGQHGNQMMNWLRQASLAILEEAFPTNSLLLEIGCGTGEEAIHLAQGGRRVVATDVSPEMVATGRRKAEAAGVSGCVEFHILPAYEVGTLMAEFGEGAFDGAYSSFGALNCEPRLGEAALGLGQLLRRDAPLVCSVMNRWCLVEVCWFLAHLKLGRAFRRVRGEWCQAPLGRLPSGTVPTVETRYFSPASFARHFARFFAVVKVIGLPVLLPPPYLDGLFSKHRRLFARLEPLEMRLRAWFPFYMLGDHFVTVMRKR